MYQFIQKGNALADVNAASNSIFKHSVDLHPLGLDNQLQNNRNRTMAILSAILKLQDAAII